MAIGDLHSPLGEASPDIERIAQFRQVSRLRHPHRQRRRYRT